ncbi:MAG: 5'-methylthioadenosine/adenosylhomocysteine nucleosidase [Lachnospiraceae bacterium]|nr:5'-methylthioadenosine/adenosylhomocysteine nucleosidase [Lachnospiraceae bacterium]MDY5742680.1 5'-methylthioadenosine/adenosylhomocysteine nucleosidase [Lachnospiraceae bacterium]
MKKIGIIGAMHVEVEALIHQMEEKTCTRKAGMEFYEGRLCNRPVVVVQSGIGKVNAAICSQLLIDLFAVDILINTGIAGALDSRLRIGDIVLSEEAVYHDMVVPGYPIGQVPGLAVHRFAADQGLLETVLKVSAEVNADIHTYSGRVVSGDQFICEPDKKHWLRDEVGGTCAEMEGAAIAHVAWKNAVAFLIIRAISDQADDQAELDYPAFEKKAAEHSVNLLLACIPQLDLVK